MNSRIKNILLSILSKMNDRIFLAALLLSASLLIVNKLNSSYLHYSTTIPVVITGAMSEYDEDVIADDSKVYFINVLVGGKGIDLLLLSLRERVAVSPELIAFEKLAKNEELFQVNKESMRSALETVLPDIDIEAIQNSSILLQTLSFAQKRVPLRDRINVNKVGEYMQIGNTILNPDSVTIYGSKSTVDTITYISTEYLYIRRPDDFLSGQVKIQRNDNYEVAPRQAAYIINMDRYTELNTTVTVNIDTLSADAARAYTRLPRRVDVVFNISHSTYSLFNPDSVRFFVDRASPISDDKYIVEWSNLPNGAEILRVEPSTISLFKNDITEFQNQKR